MPVHDIDGARAALRAGKPGELLGLAECGWLDVKSGVYQLNDPPKVEELAKDVAAFANAKSGGLLLIGFSTRKDHDTEIIDRVHPVPRDTVDLDRHHKLISERVIPAPMGVLVEWIDCGNGKGILQIDIPSQPMQILPYVVSGASRAAAGGWPSVAVPLREGDSTRWLTQAEVQRWLSAGWPAVDRPSGEFRGAPAGQLAWLVEDFPPSAAGVHRAIADLGGTDGGPGTAQNPAGRGEWWGLPPYVPRDNDALLHQRLVAAAASGGGLVLVTGRSCTGKTRSLWEAVRADEFRGWHMLRPRDAGQLRALSAAGVLQPNSFVWLDELRNFLPPDSRQGMSADDLRALWARQGPVVAVATLWPETHDEMSRPVSWSSGGADGQANQVLALAGYPVRVPDRVEGAELDRAREVAAGNGQIKLALADPDHGMTQVLAGAPWLVQRWEQPSFPYTRSVLRAAAAAWRAGARSPLPADFLRSGARAYFPDRRPAPADWFARSMEEATELIRNAVSALVPILDSGDDEQPGGYVLTDYLAQYAGEGKSVNPIPERVWQALAAEITSRQDLLRLAGVARSRMLYRFAERFYRSALAAGHGPADGDRKRADELKRAHDGLVRMLTDQGRYKEAADQERAAEPSRSRYSRNLERRLQRADVYHLKRALDLTRNASSQDLRSCIEHPPMPDKLWALARAERDDGLHAIRKFASTTRAAREAVRTFSKTGRTEEVRAITGDPLVLRGLALLLHDHGRTEEAIAFLRNSGPDDDPIQDCTRALAILLADSSRIDEALDELRRAYARERRAPLRTEEMLVTLLARYGKHDEIRRMAGEAAVYNGSVRVGSYYDDSMVAICEYGRLLAAEGRFNEASEAFWYATNEGYPAAGRGLGLAMASQGQVEEAFRLLADSILLWRADYRGKVAVALADQDRIDDLRRAAAGKWAPACSCLSVLLALHVSPEQLGKDAASGDTVAKEALARLAVMGYLAHAKELRRFGLNPDGSIPLDQDNAQAVITGSPKSFETWVS